MTGSGEERAAGTAGRGRLRASNADRERAIEVLKAAFVQGRLTRDELDGRTGQALTARTHAELATVTADIPAGLIGLQPPQDAVKTRDAVKTGIRVISSVTVPAAGAWAAWLAQPADKKLLNVVASFTLIWLGIVILTGALLLDVWRRRRAEPV